jgi:multicomponent Na+:H+ antiporter subunit D
VYWTIFAPVFAVHVQDVRALLVGIGTVTSLVGALMALMQTHLKRLLAFSTVTYAGLFLIGFAMLDAPALAGTALFVLSHAFLKGALFMSAGVLLHRWGSVRIDALRGRGRSEPVVGVLFGVAAIALLGVPPFGTFYGKQMIEESASAVGYGWVVVVFVLAAGLSGAAGLRAGAAIFLGSDGTTPPDAESEDEAHFETAAERARTPAVMVGPILVLVVVGALAPIWPALIRATEQAAVRFVDGSAYAAHVIDATPLPPAQPAETVGITLGAVLAVLATAVVAVGGAVLMILRHRLPTRAVDVGGVLARLVLRPLRAAHSGHVGDYVAWLTVGMAAFGGILAASTR